MCCHVHVQCLNVCAAHQFEVFTTTEHNSCLQLCEVGGVLQQISNKCEYNEYGGRAELCHRSSVSIKVSLHLTWSECWRWKGEARIRIRLQPNIFNVLHIHNSFSRILNEVSNLLLSHYDPVWSLVESTRRVRYNFKKYLNSGEFRNFRHISSSLP